MGISSSHGVISTSVDEIAHERWRWWSDGKDHYEVDGKELSVAEAERRLKKNVVLKGKKEEQK